MPPADAADQNPPSDVGAPAGALPPDSSPNDAALAEVNRMVAARDREDAETSHVDPIAQHVAEGHAIIDRTLERAKSLASSYPAVRALIPVIATTLHDLLAHLATDPYRKVAVAAADAAIDQVAKELTAPAAPPAAPASGDASGPDAA